MCMICEYGELDIIKYADQAMVPAWCHLNNIGYFWVSTDLNIAIKCIHIVEWLRSIVMIEYHRHR